MAGATGNGSLPGSIPDPSTLSSAAGALSGRATRAGANLSEALALAAGRPAIPEGAFGQDGIAALFNAENGIAAQLNQTLAAGMTWQEFGGFGTGTAAGSAGTGMLLDQLDTMWGATTNAEAVASMSSQLQAAIQAQAAAVSSGSAEAQAAAQAAYDDFWNSFYATADALAQEYFAMTLEDAEALYQQALVAAGVALDYYETGAQYYAEYCLYYPWDCYAYAYDAANAIYTSVEGNSDAPTSTIMMGELDSSAATLSALAAEAMLNSPEAFEAIIVFAHDQLGTTVHPVYAGALTQEIVEYLIYLPTPVAAYASMLVDATAYWGLMSNGFGGVIIADCGAEVVCNLDNMPQELSDASAGIYMLDVATPMPASPEAALDLITTVYPALNGLSFAQVIDMQASGMTFLATAYGVGADNSGQPLSVAKLIYAGVVSEGGVTTVYVMMAIGEAQVQLFYDMFQ